MVSLKIKFKICTTFLIFLLWNVFLCKLVIILFTELDVIYFAAKS